MQHDITFRYPITLKERLPVIDQKRQRKHKGLVYHGAAAFSISKMEEPLIVAVRDLSWALQSLLQDINRRGVTWHIDVEVGISGR